MKKLITLALMLTAFCGVSMADSYTVVGDNATIFGSTWNTGSDLDTGNDMVLVSGSKYRKTYSSKTLQAGTLSYKVVKDHKWGTEYPSSGNSTKSIPYTGTYDIVFELDVINDSEASCSLTLISVTPVVVYYNGSAWKVGDQLTYDGDNSYSVDIDPSSMQKFAITTETGLVKGDTYSSWQSVIKPVSSGDYQLFFQHMHGNTTTSGTDSWSFGENANITYVFTLNKSDFSFDVDGKKVVTVNATANWATFSSGISGLNQGYTVSGADAFFIASTSGGTAVLTSIASGKKIPTYPNGIMLKKIGGGSVTITTTSTSDVTLTDNMLQGSGRYDEWNLDNDGYTGYYLNNGANGLGFYPANTGYMSPYKAFLKVGKAISVRDFFSFDEETTGIKQAIANVQQTNEYFNLAGQRVAQPTKGLYIVNGKKVIIK